MTNQPPVHPFRAAIESRDMDAAIELLSEDVVLRSPVVFKPYQGREAVVPVLHGVSRASLTQRRPSHCPFASEKQSSRSSVCFGGGEKEPSAPWSLL